jgi:hypothetical protein
MNAVGKQLVIEGKKERMTVNQKKLVMLDEDGMSNSKEGCTPIVGRKYWFTFGLGERMYLGR